MANKRLRRSKARNRYRDMFRKWYLRLDARMNRIIRERAPDLDALKEI